MNTYDYDVLNAAASASVGSQREIAEICGHSLGTVNHSVRFLMENGFIDGGYCLTEKARRLLEKSAPKSAVILAAGTGMRMIPLNAEVSKGMLTVCGETLTERLIKQLHEAGVEDIYIVVGFLKEQYEYLIDMYGVKLIVNPEYRLKNNLFSLKLALEHVTDAYIIPCDLWFKDNPFSRAEMYSWYMMSGSRTDESGVYVSKKNEIVRGGKNQHGNVMIGAAYIKGSEMEKLREKIDLMSSDSSYDRSFWEEALFENDKMFVAAKTVPDGMAAEINTFEQLRQLDGGSEQLNSDVMRLISGILSVPVSGITDIELLKKGMTNHSFSFAAGGRKYIMRVPGEGTEKLIDRPGEAEAYSAVRGRGICDDVVYIDPSSGYKITGYISDARVCDPCSAADLEKCMEKLRELHSMELTVSREFDIFGQIDFYESLREGKPSLYRDYDTAKKNVFSLKEYISAHSGKKVLSHIDSVPDNFLMTPEGVRLIDWEYASMSDPHADIAMFCIYALYGRQEIDRLIDIYFKNNCPDSIRIKIYCYISACGLLWSNWCEYKYSLGVELGEYSLRQYRYAKEYYKIASELINGGI